MLINYALPETPSFEMVKNLLQLDTFSFASLFICILDNFNLLKKICGLAAVVNIYKFQGSSLYEVAFLWSTLYSNSYSYCYIQQINMVDLKYLYTCVCVCVCMN